MTVSEAVAAAAKRASEQLTFLKSIAEKVAAERQAQERQPEQKMQPESDPNQDHSNRR